jgi:signal transduction histidine kinase
MQGPTTRRSAALGIAVVIAVAFLGLAVLLAGSFGANRVAVNAERLHEANATLAETALARAATSQAIIFAADADLGLVDPESAAIAVGEAEAALSRLEQRMARLSGDTATALDEFTSAMRRVLAHIALGDFELAAGVFQQQLEPAFGSASLVFERDQQAALDSIQQTEGAAGVIAMLTRLAVTLILPVGAILVYRTLVRRRFREARIRLDAELEAEQQLNRQKDDFVAGFSHELRTPLTGITGFAEVMAETSTNTDTAEMATIIRDQSYELHRMVEDLITAARIGDPTLTSAKNTFGLREVAEAVAHRGPWNGVVKISGTDADVTANRAAVEQVLRNLLSNAARHGGHSIWVQFEPTETGFAMGVADDGDGISAEHLDRADPFAHEGLDAVITGSVGLGLTVCKALAKSMGGRLDVKRNDGWTQVSLVAPAHVMRHAGSSEAAA